MLNHTEKRIVENFMEADLLKHHKTGISSRKLITHTIDALSSRITVLNRHHCAGFLAYLIAKYSHTFILKAPGQSIIQ